jgi:tRNA (cytidine/uridine-2'-O-)-methyltransferase
MHLVLYQPEIPQNVGTLARTASCFGVALHVIGPLGFVLSDRRLHRAGMDYIHQRPLTSHSSWQAFQKVYGEQRQKGGRLLALVARGGIPYTDFAFHTQDMICGGPESTGLPSGVTDQAQGCLSIPMPGGGRSLNLAIACSIVLAEACRQMSQHSKSEGGPLPSPGEGELHPTSPPAVLKSGS